MQSLDPTLHTRGLHGRLQTGFLVLANAISHGRGLTSLWFCLIRKLLMSGGKKGVNE